VDTAYDKTNDAERLQKNAFSVFKMREQMKDENTQCTIVIDCGRTETVGADASQDDELGRTKTPEKTSIIYSYKAGQSSKDKDGYRTLSIFTECFLENLRSGLSSGEVFNRTRDDVKKRALDSGNEQEPEIDGEAEFYF